MTTPTPTRPLLTVTICALVAFVAILTVYWFIASNPVLARIPFAVMMSVPPAIVTWISVRKRSTATMVIVYFVLFVVWFAIQAWVR